MRRFTTCEGMGNFVQDAKRESESDGGVGRGRESDGARGLRMGAVRCVAHLGCRPFASGRVDAEKVITVARAAMRRSGTFAEDSVRCAEHRQEERKAKKPTHHRGGHLRADGRSVRPLRRPSYQCRLTRLRDC